jgi:hypothetical protein
MNQEKIEQQRLLWHTKLQDQQDPRRCLETHSFQESNIDADMKYIKDNRTKQLEHYAEMMEQLKNKSYDLDVQNDPADILQRYSSIGHPSSQL